MWIKLWRGNKMDNNLERYKKQDSRRISVILTEEQNKFFIEHPGVIKSRFIRDAIDKLIKEGE